MILAAAILISGSLALLAYEVRRLSVVHALCGKLAADELAERRRERARGA